MRKTYDFSHSRSNPYARRLVKKATSAPEVTNISSQGFWIFFENEELFVSFADHPWFKDATISQICRIEKHGQTVLHWPDLDVDLSPESIRHPERSPLVSRVSTAVADKRRKKT